MSEIKGQLLGIILVLIVFGAISVTMATVFKSTAGQVAERSTNLGDAAEDKFNESEEEVDDPGLNGLLRY